MIGQTTNLPVSELVISGKNYGLQDYILPENTNCRFCDSGWGA